MSDPRKATIDIRGGNGVPVDARPGAVYCPICGLRANGTGPAVERFGEAFCSEAHADEFAQAVRAARFQAAVGRVDRAAGACGAAVRTSSGWKGSLGRALCWGGPALALVAMAVILSRGGGVLLGAASAALPVLAALACPLGMYLMMRSMSKKRHQDGREADGGTQRGRAEE